MKYIYILTAGSYADYQILDAYKDRPKANRARDKYNQTITHQMDQARVERLEIK